MLYQYKIICIGQSGVGKTSLLGRCRDSNVYEDTNDLPQKAKPTICMDFISLKFEINSETVKLHIWDTAGQQRYAAINKNYYQGSLGAIIVVSVEKSLEEILYSIERHLEQYTNIVNNQNIFIIFNKIDLINLFDFQKQFGINQHIKLLRQKYRIKSINFLSAKTSPNHQIKLVLESILNTIFQQNQQRYSQQPHSMILDQQNNPQRSKRKKQTIKKKKCC